MTEIRIDNRPVAIGDTTFELVAYNPLADETADHTYDIDIDLSIPANAAALGHIGRLDRDLAAAWGEYRSGAVLADGRTIISGRAYLLSIADGRAKVQIVAEDHARRYTEDDEEGEGAFAMGSARIDSWLGFRNLDLSNCVLKETAKSWRHYIIDTGGRQEINHYYHPRLVDTIEEAFDAMGFTITDDCLRRSDYAMSIYIISITSSRIWGDHLPPWSLAKLSREVEKMFNVQVLVDPETMTVSIGSMAALFGSTVDIEIFDDWELEVEDEGEGLNAYENVRYDLPDGQYYAEADLHDGQEELFAHRTAQHGTAATDTGRYIWDDTNDDGQVLGSYVCYEQYYAAPVNNYAHRGKYDADNTVKLAIVPAEHTCLFFELQSVLQPYFYIIPVGCDYERPEVADDKTNLEIITEGTPESGADNGQQMRVAIFRDKATYGMCVPFSICTAGLGFGQTFKTEIYPSYSRGNYFPNGKQQTDTLTLDNLAREFRWGYNIETLRSRHRYKVRAQWPWTERLQQFRVRCRGKHFVIYSVKHTLTERGFDPVAEIEMYPIDD